MAKNVNKKNKIGTKTLTINLGSFDKLNFSDGDVLEREDEFAFLADFLGNKVSIEIVEELIYVSLSDLGEERVNKLFVCLPPSQ